METISEIITDMRKRFEPYAKSDSNDARYVAYLGYAEFADRIERAVTNCNQLKMREALLKSRKAMDEMSRSIFQGWIEDGLAEVMGEAQRDISSALAAPPRNCDLYSNKEEAKMAWARQRYKYMTTGLSYGDWLFSEVKGETK